MEDPEQYTKGNQPQRKDAVELLSEYIHLVKWRHSDDEVVLDVGCGSGDVTCEVLKPLLPLGAHLVGIDVSEKMVKYAAQRYPKTEFMVLDIGTKNLPEKLENSFDHLFSFHCLHWIQDQRQVMQNLYYLLKAGGSMFVYYIANSPIYDMYIKMAEKEKWKNYMLDVGKYIPPHQKDKNEQNLINILNDVGFNVSVCKCVKKEVIFPNVKFLSNSLLGVNPYYPNLPQELKAQFREDIITEFLDLKAIKERNQQMSDEVIMPHKFNIIFATKPEKK